MNIVILLVEICVVFGGLLLMHRLFKKEGVFVWIGLASVLANLFTAKNADIFGLTTAIGSVLFASTFLGTDILTENYGKEEAKKGVFIGLCSTLIFIVTSQIALAYIPSAIDYADGAMRTLFSMNLRISVSSVVMYFIANMCDVYLYEKIRERMNGKHLWVRNNVSTILCNCAENFFFMFFAFFGLYDLKTVAVMALSTSAIETFVGICDTPFLYIATRRKHGKGKTVVTRTGECDT